MELIPLILLGSFEALALLGDGMNQHWSLEVASTFKMTDDSADVMPVNRACVLQPKVGEHPLRCKNVLHARLESMQEVVDGPAQQRHPVELVLDEAQGTFIALVGTQPGKVLGKPADRRGVGAAVVVDDDHDSQVRLGGDVV